MNSLPELFDSYNDARKEGFLKVRDLKEEGVPIVGIFCTYTPVEIIRAIGAIAVGLCGKDEDTIAEAEKHLPRNICPLIKSSYGYAVSGRCPYFYFADLVIGETTCDAKKKMYELLSEVKSTYVMQLPQTMYGEDSLKLWKSEIMKLKEKLETTFNKKITDEMLMDQIRLRNKERKLTKEFYSLNKYCPPMISGYDLQTVLEGGEFKLDREEFLVELEELIEKTKEDYKIESNRLPKDAPRILITGSPISGVTDKVIKAIEESGGLVVCYETCGGAKSTEELVDETMDPMDALAKKYLKIPCSVMTPNTDRFDLLGRLVDEYKIDGVIEVTLQACHTYNVETMMVRKFLKTKSTSYMHLETDYSQNDKGQIKTRLEAFIEML